MTMGYLFWYGYHVPAVRRRDIFYEKLEEERIAKYGGKLFSFGYGMLISVPPPDDAEEE